MDFTIFISWINEHALKVLIIVIGASLSRRFGILFLEGFVRRAVKTSRFQSEAEHKQREQTLLDVSRSVFGILVWIVASILIFLELDINIQPLLAAGGFLGILVGFGAQNILKDVFAGIYVITEHQYQVGDAVDLDGDIGVVEDITLRMTTLRDLDGTVHHVSHGTINRAKNLSKNYARVNLDIGIAYDSDIEQVISVVNEVGKKLSQEDDWKLQIITPPQFLRIEDFGDSSIVIKIIGETRPLKQWAVSGELRKRLKIAFDTHGIEIPFPQRVIHQAENKKTEN